MELGLSTQNDFTFFLIVLLITLGALVATRKLLRVDFPYFFMGVLGVIVGVFIGSLVGKSLGFLPGSYGKWLPIIVEVLVAVAIFDLFIGQSKAVAKFFSGWLKSDSESSGDYQLIIDTSVFIDGRITELASTGFICGKLIVPKFVLLELQILADSQEELKRVKGRKGLEVLADLQRNRQVNVEITDEKLKDKDKVDSKLVRMAKDRGAKIMTVDYNLAQVAQIQGVGVLNINAIAVAVKPQLVPGEVLVVQVVQKGKEKHQGVGYLEDGTMVVVDAGDKYVGKEIECVVGRIYQTSSGKMIFVEPKSL